MEPPNADPGCVQSCFRNYIHDLSTISYIIYWKGVIEITSNYAVEPEKTQIKINPFHEYICLEFNTKFRNFVTDFNNSIAKLIFFYWWKSSFYSLIIKSINFQQNLQQSYEEQTQ